MQSLRCALLAVCLFVPTGVGAFTIFSDSAVDIPGVTDTVNLFRAALGDPNNLNNAGPLPSGRREINWDGGGPPLIDGTAPVTPFTVFQNTRGGTFTTPGTGLTQAAATGGTLSLDLINPTYDDLFAPFSLNRLFTPLNSNVTEGFFSIPGTGGTIPAGVSGFGVVFSDVDLGDTTTVQFFDAFGGLIDTLPVPAIAGNQTFSFLGIVLDPGEGLISRVVITTGTDALGPNESATIDLVVMDDFLYGEPQRIPQPQALALLGSGLVAMGAMAWRRARSRK